MSGETLATSEENSHEKNVQIAIESVLGSKTSRRKSKKTPEELKLDTFCGIIYALEAMEDREALLKSDFNLDLTEYNDIFHIVIDGLMELHFNKIQLKFIKFYLCDRLDEDGNVIVISLGNGKNVTLNTPIDLYNLIKTIKS